jgi:cell division protease FtsH
METRLVYSMGGRVAEKLIFKEYNTGAGMDIQQATVLARKMVCNWGMSEKLGPVDFGSRKEHIFLGREIQDHKNYSEATAQLIDSEIKRFVEEAEETATRLLSDNVEKLHRLAEALLEKEIIDGNEIDDIINPPDGKSEETPEKAPQSD